MKNRRVFISGGAGVIGNEMVMKLHELGAVVFVGDIKPRPSHWPKSIIYRQGDLNFITEREINSFAPEFFFHLAATFERSAETYEFWTENFRHNINLSNHLMTLMRNISSLKRVVFASSYLIYNPELYNFSVPQNSAKRLQENDAIYPRNLTGVAKLLHEIELRFLNNFENLPFTSVSARIYRGYGKNSRDIISRWVRSLLKNEEITVYKKEGMFDYIYAEDTAEGLIKLALNKEVIGLINLGNDNARRVEEVVQVLKKYFPNAKVKECDSDILYEASQANMDLYEKTIGWKPMKQLEDTIPKIIEFEKSNNKLEKMITGNVLITSISKKVPLIKAVKQAANKVKNTVKVIGGDVNENCIGKYFVDEFWLMPFIKNLDSKQVIEFCKSKNIKLIIPTRDGELVFWSSISEELKKNGISVCVSNLEQIQICLDKDLFYKFCKENHINAIPTSTQIDTIDSAEKFVVKERYGAGSISIGLDLDKESAISHAKKLHEAIFQPFIKGNEISIDAYIDKSGNIKGVFLRKRELVVDGESQITTSFKSGTLETLFTDIIRKLKLRGHVVLQAIIDENNHVHLIECNSRFGGASTLSISGGLDSFYWAILEAFGEDLDSYPFLPTETPIKQIRFPNDLVIDDSCI